ncbi:conserved membrane protein of unknown function [Xenorhabdus poinarii G6]|uniref:Inner membrane protein ydcZ n=1 Tax=Xenorhabdus poinarii G6 TaxID=1354304 RepID=A0A068R8A2_9GAMM|nr:DMT family transporter [Xenorhabdus poinarii]CDG22345.1 conserved membrane protein of unknown function [Xenorhabdus poinarii G6]
MSSNFTITLFILSLIAVIAGALVPFQAGSNAFLGKELGHPLWATVVSLLVSLFVVLPVIWVLKVPMMKVEAISSVPWWAWFGGIAGVIYISAALILTPKLGATAFIVCVISGQVIVSLIIDKFGLMGLPIKEMNTGRIFGVFLIILGMVLVQYFTVGKNKQVSIDKEITQETSVIEYNK